MKKPQEKERVVNPDTQEEPEQEPVTPEHEPAYEQADDPNVEADNLDEVCDGAAAVAVETEDDEAALPVLSADKQETIFETVESLSHAAKDRLYAMGESSP